MHKFHKALAGRAQTKAELETLFGQIKKKFGEIPEFAEFTTSLRRQLGDLISTMTHRLEVDFEAYNPANFFHVLRLHANDGTSPCTLEEMGTGETQILAISFAHAFAKAFHGGIVIVIEEPESHLHPLAQQWLARKLHELSNGGLQILITTHSPHFIDIMSLDGLVLFRKDSSSTYAVQLSAQKLAESCVKQGAPAERVHPASIGPFYHSSVTPEILEGFFARAVVLVDTGYHRSRLTLII
jgi:putative ATP-dependent endonuclease of the OLD family